MGAGIWIALGVFALGGVAMGLLLFLGKRWGAQSQATADATHTEASTDAMLQAAVAPGHDPAAVDRSLRDGSF